ncbi:carboxypeptidase-like regulatory domain-containing protein [Aquirufa beregesia]
MYVVLLLTSFIVHAQQHPIQLLSRADSAVIPFASVLFESRKLGFHTDEQGRFSITSKQAVDTIKIRAIGFGDTILIINKARIKPNFIIFLEPNSTILQEVKVFSGNKSFTSMKHRKTGELQQWGGVGSQYGLLLDEEKLMGRKMTKVHFYLAHGGNFNYPFRIRIYSIKHGKPDIELTKESIVVRANHKGWNEFEISQYDLFVPDSGCLVAMEWLNFENLVSVDLILTQGKYAGQVLGMGDFGNRYMGFVKDDFSPWHFNGDYLPRYQLPDKSKFMNPMIRLTVK